METCEQRAVIPARMAEQELRNLAGTRRDVQLGSRLSSTGLRIRGTTTAAPSLFVVTNTAQIICKALGRLRRNCLRMYSFS